MAEGPFPRNIKEAVPYLTWGVVIFTFLFVFVEKFVEAEYGRALLSLVSGLIVTAVALHAKNWLERTNPNWAFAAALALLVAIVTSPFVEQKRLPFSASLQTESNTAAQKSTLMEWLQQAQGERDEAKQGAAAAEAQKATLMGWIQQAQRERDNARQELNQLQKQMQDARSRASSTTFPLHSPVADNAAQECINLAHHLAELNPKSANDKAEIDHIRSTMTALGCGCASTK